MIEVFIEAAAGSPDKHIFNETNFVHLGVRTALLPYPYPYGFVPGTAGEDDEALDSYIITSTPLAVGSRVTCEAVAVLEFYEDDQLDHKLISVLPGESTLVDSALRDRLAEFIVGIFRKFPEIEVSVGELQPRQAALDLLCRSFIP